MSTMGKESLHHETQKALERNIGEFESSQFFSFGPTNSLDGFVIEPRKIFLSNCENHAIELIDLGFEALSATIEVKCLQTMQP